MPLNFTITPVNTSLKSALQNKIDQKTKPLGALGQLEALVLQIGLIQNTLTPCLNRASLLVFAGDHGSVAAGVSAYPQSVTAQMVSNFLSGGAAVSVFAQQNKLHLLIIDAGVNGDLAPHPQLLNLKIAKGTRNFLTTAAMTAEQCQQAIAQGAAVVLQQHQQACNTIGLGEMGIGNTSSAALLMHGLTQIPLVQCAGRGTGLDDNQLQHKLAILQQALAQHPNLHTPLDWLSTFGGFEIAMMVGAYLKAAELGMLIIVDGFIASSALLVAHALHPQLLGYCVFSHVSNEHGHRALLDFFDVEPVLNLQLRLGEGSGVALAYPLVQSAVLFLNNMASFADAGVDQTNA